MILPRSLLGPQTAQNCDGHSFSGSYSFDATRRNIVELVPGFYNCVIELVIPVTRNIYIPVTRRANGYTIFVGKFVTGRTSHVRNQSSHVRPSLSMSVCR